MSRPVRLWFDYVSPYSYLALAGAQAFAAEHDVAWEVRPVLYAALLDATGLPGPAEIPIKRRYTIRDVARCASLLGVPLVGPPAHPFRSLEALRATALFADDPRALRLAVGLSRAAWAEGRDLTRMETIANVVESAGLDASHLSARIGSPDAKAALKALTDEAISAGVFGVPTFGLDGELFWGHDRMGHLAARLEGRLPDLDEDVDAILARPRAADRPGVAERFEADGSKGRPAAG